jgi:hypothetical protein
VAAYSALLLAGLLAYGPERGAAYPALPKWRGNAKRPPCLDLITLLRKEMVDNQRILAGLQLDWKALGLAVCSLTGDVQSADRNAIPIYRNKLR